MFEFQLKWLIQPKKYLLVEQVLNMAVHSIDADSGGKITARLPLSSRVTSSYYCHTMSAVYLSGYQYLLVEWHAYCTSFLKY